MQSHLFIIPAAATFLLGGMCQAQEAATSGSPAPPDAKPEINTPTPRIWIFNGVPGDDEHHDFYETNIASLRKSLTGRFAVPAENITVLYGPRSAGYDGPCTREALLAQLAEVVAYTKKPDAGQAWIILQGHANPVKGGAMFNLPGPDVSMREITHHLKDAAPAVPLILMGTTTASADLVGRLTGPGRFVITAATAGDKENETEFPSALAASLESEASDANGDGILTLTELFLAANAAVLAIYKEGDFIVKEHAQLDGNGDGKATQRPSPEDAGPANRIGLATGGGKPAFE